LDFSLFLFPLFNANKQVCGNAYNSPLNVMAAIGAHAAILRELGQPLEYPGGNPGADETSCLRHFIPKAEYLPRQARDKHTKAETKEPFSAGSLTEVVDSRLIAAAMHWSFTHSGAPGKKMHTFCTVLC
jgi:hypothetical protein